MKKGSIITAITVLLVPMMAMAQKQYFLPTGSADMSENDKPMIEVYLPRQDVANGCAVVLCPGGAMRWLSWDSDVVKMAQFLNERGIAAIGLRYHLNKGYGQMPKDVKMLAQTPSYTCMAMAKARTSSCLKLAKQPQKHGAPS
ncbi:hypothetical protein [Xylanibacter ruminicola]|uniref:Alpha/beta hydrolase fold n=1 Tax=Xylanibacter ruminicola TaxID=839 RepID=A0A1M6Y1Y3_XYLRU|nr:hypothetical protein [Xylanibacter ruminicola]SHL12174.1 hypothetical protein SAMN05216463_12361 [Xylanibacter ruminicola]